MVKASREISLVNLRAQQEPILEEIRAGIDRVLSSCQFALGSEVAAFETEFAEFCGCKYAVGVNSGTSALHLALLTAGVRPGDEVITVPLTFVATAAAIRYAQARPVFADIDPRTYTLDPQLIEERITDRTKAIVPVHLYGQAVDMEPIMRIATLHDLVVVEDACQAHGATYLESRVGSIGNLACFSCYPSKNLGAYGEGGIVTTNSRTLCDRVRSLRDWGQTRRYHHAELGFNYRMDGIQAAVLRVKLKHLDCWNEKRRALARIYDERLCRAPIITPYQREGSTHVYHLYVIQVDRRDELRGHLEEQGIKTGIHYPVPIHRMAPFLDLGYPPGAFPESETAAKRVLSLPLYAELPETSLERVAEAIDRLSSA